MPTLAMVNTAMPCCLAGLWCRIVTKTCLTIDLIVVHLGLIPASRIRQVQQLHQYIAREVPEAAPLLVAGDFNDWGARISNMMHAHQLNEWSPGQHATYPSRLPIVQLDHVYARGLKPVGQTVPRGKIWRRMSDHLPLLAQFD